MNDKIEELYGNEAIDSFREKLKLRNDEISQLRQRVSALEQLRPSLVTPALIMDYARVQSELRQAEERVKAADVMAEAIEKLPKTIVEENNLLETVSLHRAYTAYRRISKDQL